MFEGQDHAQITTDINRIARRVAEGEGILNPSSYAMGVARLLLLEIVKGRQREQSALTEAEPRDAAKRPARAASDRNRSERSIQEFRC
jgi:hypothetical protein